MSSDQKNPMVNGTHRPFSWADAIILSIATFGILIGVSFVNFQIAVLVGLAILGYVIVKLLTTKPE